MSESELEIMFIPSLVEILTISENAKGTPLAQEEVLHIRDKAVCITLRKSASQKIKSERGFKDINPENCWEEWLEFKKY